tara:strand:- start:539 stop:1231 length:693 start_codon:yes stop_codon:yes gene_type:complete
MLAYKEALSCLQLENDPARCDAYRRAIREVVRAIKEAHKKQQPKRSEIRKPLDDISKHSRILQRALLREGVREALRYGLNSDMSHEGAELLKAMEDEEQLSILLNALERTSVNAVEKLGLKGRKGLAGPWVEMRYGPKECLAAYGLGIFRKARDLKRQPNHNNMALNEFLDTLWQLATGDEKVQDWEDTIKKVRLKKGGSLRPADLDTRLAVSSLLEKIDEWERGYRNPK